MKKIGIDKVNAGEILARDIYDASGNQLLKAGSELTKIWLSRLQKRNVGEVCIEDAFDRAERAAAQELSSQALETGADDDDPLGAMVLETETVGRLDKMLEGVGDETLRRQLREAAISYLRSRSWNPEA